MIFINIPASLDDGNARGEEEVFIITVPMLTSTRPTASLSLVDRYVFPRTKWFIISVISSPKVPTDTGKRTSQQPIVLCMQMQQTSKSTHSHRRACFNKFKLNKLHQFFLQITSTLSNNDLIICSMCIKLIRLKMFLGLNITQLLIPYLFY